MQQPAARDPGFGRAPSEILPDALRPDLMARGARVGWKRQHQGGHERGTQQRTGSPERAHGAMQHSRTDAVNRRAWAHHGDGTRRRRKGMGKRSTFRRRRLSSTYIAVGYPTTGASAPEGRVSRRRRGRPRSRRRRRRRPPPLRRPATRTTRPPRRDPTPPAASRRPKGHPRCWPDRRTTRSRSA
jgi:hypothetical protein